MWKAGFVWENCVADTGYSSGENYAFLESNNLKSFIPPHGIYKGGPEDFIYNEQEGHYRCLEGKIIPFKKVFLDHRTQTKKKEYRASSKLCSGCPIKEACLGKSKEKRITVTYYRKKI